MLSVQKLVKDLKTLAESHNAAWFIDDVKPIDQTMEVVQNAPFAIRSLIVSIITAAEWCLFDEDGRANAENHKILCDAGFPVLERMKDGASWITVEIVCGKFRIVVG